MMESLYIPILWLLFAVFSIAVCRISMAESVGFSRKTVRKHPKCKPRNLIESLSGRHYLRWKKANNYTCLWYRSSVFLVILVFCELLFLFEHIIFVRGDMHAFFTWVAGGRAGIVIIGFLPASVYVPVYIASKPIPDKLKSCMLEAVCPLWTVLIAIGVFALILLAIIWKLRDA